MAKLVRAVEQRGHQEILLRKESGLDYLELSKLKLSQGERYQAETEGWEVVLVILSGVASISSENNEWSHLGGRKDVFDGKATAVYIPCRSTFAVYAESEVEIAICRAKADEKFQPFVVKPEEVVVNRRGENNWHREVHDIIVANGENRVQRIVIGETFNEPGQWSSFPPHKHDGEHAPEEPDLEEIYHYQVHPQQGFGVQMHYVKDDGIDDAYTVRHGDSFAIDHGYHPVAAAGGYRLYYLWFLAGGSGRDLRPYDDPDHRWLIRKE
ncbi:5-deoxy-glucuronate isomerase [Desmospora activa]|uniref:5-deoxy-glucuronate isomerase n=1 Tax=Desmospora activa DSM 45169 TaxID=1121389 RepID=A0A2T4ZDM0_9BACL|nr:5-deoxy-glucuronate isomerase [Desmospora activa]PTM59994.1 5-deoxyglucuronate isomerase [Desmospora activa DSM 45169]